MQPAFRNGFLGGLFLACILGTWLFRLWSPENQVRLHSAHLLRQLEKHDWSQVENFLAPDYHDDWGDDRTRLMTRLRMVGRYIFDLTITTAETRVRVAGKSGIWQGRIRLSGRGEGAAEIIGRVNSLTTPFLLQWRRQSWKPWHWKLERVTNESLEIPGDPLETPPSGGASVAHPISRASGAARSWPRRCR